MPLDRYFDVRKELQLIQEHESNKEKADCALVYLEDIQREFFDQASSLISELPVACKVINSPDTATKIESSSWEVAAIETMIFLGQRNGIPWQFFADELSRVEEWFQKQNVLATH